MSSRRSISEKQSAVQTSPDVFFFTFAAVSETFVSFHSNSDREIDKEKM